MWLLEQGISRTDWLTKWRPEDRSLIVACLLEKAEQCAMCGSADWEWEEDPDAYRALHMTCLGCAAKDRARSSEDTDTSTPGSSIRLVPTSKAIRMASVRTKRPKSRRERKAESQ